MKRRFLAVLLAALMVCSLLPVTAGAAEGNLVAELIEDGEASGKFLTLEELSAENSRNINERRTLKLLDDVTLNVIAGAGNFLALGLQNGILDLNGHTLTIYGEDAAEDSTVIGVGTFSGSSAEDASFGNTIRNGTIILDNGNFVSAVLDFIGKLIVENVAFELGENGSILEEAGAAIIKAGAFQDPKGELILSNCVVDMGEASAVIAMPLGPGDWDGSSENVVIESGSYKNLTSGEETHIQVLGQPITVPDVNENATVYTSNSTTALIVENGNAYLYDSLADAVAAVERGRGATGDTPAAITLLKTTDETVTIDPDT